MNQLSPTLVVGLGTFGGRTVSHLRSLLYEEIGEPGLPFFRFVHISSHKDDENIKPQPGNHVGQKEWEKFHVLHSVISVDDMQTIRTLLDGTSTRADEEPGWQDWLDADLIKMCESAYIAGAGNSRMIGKSCLWNNFVANEAIKTRLTNMVTEITAPDKQVDTEEVLRKYLDRKQGNINDSFSFSPSKELRVYIISTLCGGTGSGMFLDLAFMLRSSIRSAKNIFGIFSVPDMNTATSTQHARISANAFSALIELDYYSRDNTVFEARFPGDQVDTTVTDYPFDYIQLVSPSSKGSKFQIGSSSIADDVSIKALSTMCATSLFFELFGGAGTEKAGIWCNYPAKSDQWRKPRKLGPGYIQALSTYGASTAHYPKYRIAGAAACLQIQEKLFEWWGMIKPSGSKLSDKKKNELPRDPHRMGKIAKRWFASMCKQGLTEVTATSGKNIRDEWLNQTRNLIHSDMDVEQLKDTLSALPVPKAFAIDGKFTKIIQGRLEPFMLKAYDSFENLVYTSIDTIFTDKQLTDDNPATILELKEVIELVVGKLDETIQNGPSYSNGQFDSSRFTGLFEEMTLAQNSLAATLLLQTKKIQSYYRRQIVDKFIQLMNKEYIKMEDTAIASVFPELKDDIQRGPAAKIDHLIDRINQCNLYIEERFKDLSYMEEWHNLILVSKSDIPKSSRSGFYNDIIEAKDLFRDQLWKQVSHRIKEKTDEPLKNIMLDVSAKPSAIMDLLMDQVSHEIMSELRTVKFDLVDTLIQRYDQQLTSLAERSLPMIELSEHYHDIFGSGNHPVLICGGKRNSLKKLQDYFKSHGIHTFDKVGSLDTFLDHMIHFYQEEGGIALDELKAYEPMKNQYDKYRKADEPVSRIVHTHKDASQFDISYIRRMEKLTRETTGKPSAFRIAIDFIPGAIFEKRGKEYLFEWNEFGINMDALYKPKEPNKLLRELSRSEKGDEMFIEKVKEELEKRDDHRMRKIWESRRNKVINNYGRESIQMKNFTNYFNKDFLNKKDFPWF
jgi:hypothetical protein